MQLGLVLDMALEVHLLPVTHSFLAFMMYVTLAMGHSDAALFCVMFAIPVVFAILTLTIIYMTLLRGLIPSTVVGIYLALCFALLSPLRVGSCKLQLLFLDTGAHIETFLVG
eukprot:1669736-Ditylum_brightwellii.AAC.1